MVLVLRAFTELDSDELVSLESGAQLEAKVFEELSFMNRDNDLAIVMLRENSDESCELCDVDLVHRTGVAGSIYVQHQSAVDTSLATLNQHRRDTYERYAADLAQLNEVLWANVYWTGDLPTAAQSAEFSNKAQPISASLGGDEAAIKVISSTQIWSPSPEPDGSGPIMDVHAAWTDMLRHFKCSSGLQGKDDCPNDLPLLNKADISAKLIADSNTVESKWKIFLQAARSETNSNRR